MTKIGLVLGLLSYSILIFAIGNHQQLQYASGITSSSSTVCTNGQCVTTTCVDNQCTTTTSNSTTTIPDNSTENRDNILTPALVRPA